MAGDLKLTKLQLNDSATPANNFFIDTSGNDGTLIIRRGNIGAPIEDVLKINAAGEIILKGGANLGSFAKKSFSANDFFPLPNGVIVQMGIASVNGAITFPIEFPNACLAVTFGRNVANESVPGADSITKTGFSYRSLNVANSASRYIAIGF